MTERADRWSQADESGPGEHFIIPGRFRGYKLSGWLGRMASRTIDWLVCIVLPAQFLDGEVALFVGIALTMLNVGVMGSRTGQSLGMMLLNQRMIQSRFDGVTAYVTYVPLPVALIRVLLQWLDWVTVIGIFLPLIHRNRCFLSDLLTRTLVFHDRKLPPSIDSNRGKLDW